MINENDYIYWKNILKGTTSVNHISLTTLLEKAFFFKSGGIRANQAVYNITLGIHHFRVLVL